jgi:hypothetical protein
MWALAVARGMNVSWAGEEGTRHRRAQETADTLGRLAHKEDDDDEEDLPVSGGRCDPAVGRWVAVTEQASAHVRQLL